MKSSRSSSHNVLSSARNFTQWLVISHSGLKVEHAIAVLKLKQRRVSKGLPKTIELDAGRLDWLRALLVLLRGWAVSVVMPLQFVR